MTLAIEISPADLPDLKRLMAREAWFRGDLSYLLRPHGQTQAYRFVHDWKTKNPHRAGPMVLNCRRAFGKTFFLLLLAAERCARYPNQEVKFGAPTFKQGLEIISPILKTVLADCPIEIMDPAKDWSASKIVFHNPRWKNRRDQSTLTLIGCKDDAESQRGPRSDMVVLDECRDIPNFEYVVRSVFAPHFVGRTLPLMVLSSTPPNSTDHPFVEKYIPEAAASNRYFFMPGSRDLDMSAMDKLMLLDICGPEGSSDWQREVECSLIPDPTKLIIPEFQSVKDFVVVDNLKRPECFFPHVCVDFGFMDFSAVLYGYPDFMEQTLVIEDELFVNYKTTGDLARMMAEKEKHVFNNPPWPIRRFGDNDMQQLADLRGDYHYGITAADKYDRESACARLRTRFQSGKIRIHSRCKALIHQLNTGLRKPSGDFERTEKYGHCDSIAALIYLNRMANFHANPFPAGTPDPSIYRPEHRQKETFGSLEITDDPLILTERAVV